MPYLCLEMFGRLILVKSNVFMLQLQSNFITTADLCVVAIACAICDLFCCVFSFNYLNIHIDNFLLFCTNEAFLVNHSQAVLHHFCCMCVCRVFMYCRSFSEFIILCIVGTDPWRGFSCGVQVTDWRLPPVVCCCSVVGSHKLAMEVFSVEKM